MRSRPRLRQSGDPATDPIPTYGISLPSESLASVPFGTAPQASGGARPGPSEWLRRVTSQCPAQFLGSNAECALVPSPPFRFCSVLQLVASAACPTDNLKLESAVANPGRYVAAGSPILSVLLSATRSPHPAPACSHCVIRAGPRRRRSGRFVHLQKERPRARRRVLCEMRVWGRSLGCNRGTIGLVRKTSYEHEARNRSGLGLVLWTEAKD
jgi:hypothetical protein